MNNTTAVTPTYTIGEDLTVNRLGYGAMRLSGQPGNFGAYADWEGGKQLLRRAVELGVNFIDTALSEVKGTLKRTKTTRNFLLTLNHS